MIAYVITKSDHFSKKTKKTTRLQKQVTEIVNPLFTSSSMSLPNKASD